ncbi:MAG: FeoB-associated Cys-rich membrane protein [Firmicutes bacterium]|nr:FeoB-associated Cys-rich membrane protein [Bacillota bacterium]
MLAWLGSNLIDIVVCALLLLAVALIIRGLARDKRAGKSACGCNCSACGGCCQLTAEHRRPGSSAR